MNVSRKVAAAAGVALFLAIAWSAWPESRRCPLDLPAEYRFVNFYPSESSWKLALACKLATRFGGSPSQVGTGRSWLYEAAGPAHESVPRLAAFLRKEGRWTLKQSSSGRMWVLHNPRRKLLVAVFPAFEAGGYRSPSRHMVRVNGPWREAGSLHLMLSGLPEPWLRHMGGR